MSGVHEVIVPRLGVNDDSVRVVAWRVAPGARVERGMVLAELETAKANFELEAEAGGFFYPLITKGTEAPIRTAIALLVPTPDGEAIACWRAGHSAPLAPLPAEQAQLTTKARLLAESLGLNLAALPTGRILREEDIRSLAGAEATPSIALPEYGDAVVYGASQGGQVVVESMLSAGRYRPVAYLDDDPERIGTDFEGLPVWSGSVLAALKAKGIVGIGTHMAKASARLGLRARAAAAQLPLLNVVHARAFVAPTVRMGIGNLIKAGATVDSYVVLGDCCIIDNGAIVPHHNQLGSGVHLAPGVSMGGDCRIGDESIIGVGASIAPRTQIGRRVIVGVGAVITRDLPDGAVVLGVPGEAHSGQRR